MAQEETILLHFDIDEQPAVNSIKDLRTANSQLRKERDAVNISTKEGQELVQKLNVTIDKNNKLIKDNSSALEKQRQNVGNYTESIKGAAGELNIMGTNVGALTTKIASFANPATAAIGIVSALGAAYARSSIGAKDLEFASNQLGFAIDILTDKFAGLFSSVEDGQGLVTSILDGVLARVDLTTAIVSKLAAQSIEDINTIKEEAGLVQAKVNERLAENADLMEDIANTELTIQKRLDAAQKIRDNITSNANDLLAIKNKEIEAENFLLSVRKSQGGDTGDIELRVNKLIAERAALLTSESRQNTKIDKQVNAINKAEAQRLELLKKQRDETERKIKAQQEAEARELLNRDVSFRDSPQSKGLIGSDYVQDQFEKDSGAINDLLGLTISAEDQKRAELLRTNALKAELAEEEYQRNLEIAAGARDLTAALAAIAEEGSEAQQVIALTTIATNAGIGVSEAVKAGAGLVWPANLTAILSGVTAVLAGIAQAKGLLGFAEGGWTGPGSKYKAVGVVHADEYVAPKHIVNNPAAQPHLRALENMRTGYADGGFVANTNMQPAQQAMLMMNFMKNLPPTYVSWTEGRKIGKQVEFKERVTRQ